MKYYVYGAGKNLNMVLRKITGFLEVEGIIDKDESKIGKSIDSMKVISAKDFFESKFDNKQYGIIVSVTNPKYQNEIKEEISEKGYKYISASSFCNFHFEPLPGTVTGVIKVPDGYKARHSCDPNSFLIKDCENKVYRVIKSGIEESTKHVFEKCKKGGLFGKYVINSNIRTDVPGFENHLLIEHEFLNTISFCYEWPPKMYEDYVEFMFNLILALNHAGLCLIDAHGLNATLKDADFIFYDFGAIGEGVIAPRQLIEVIDTLVLPLVLMKKGEMKKAYLYLENHSILLNIQDIKGYLNRTELSELQKIYEKAIWTISKKDAEEVVSALMLFCKEMRTEYKNGDWENYQDSEWEKDNDRKKWSIKMHSVTSMIEKVSPCSIIDIAGNQGWYGAYFREKTDFVIVVDMDSTALDKLWHRVKKNKLLNVFPVYMSICAPSLGRHYDGFVDGSTVKKIRKSAIDRYKSELAIALAIVHHLAFREHLSFEEIIKVIAAYTYKYLVIEFVDQTDEFITYFNKKGYEWYTQSGFEEALESEFKIIETKPSSPKGTRTLYLCEKL